MSATMWRLLSVDAIEDDPEYDTVTFELLGPEDKIYCVALSAPKDASASEYANALRAATAAYINMADGDTSVVGATISEQEPLQRIN